MPAFRHHVRACGEVTLRKLTAHLKTIAEEVASVRHKGHQARLDPRKLGQMRMFQGERTSQPKHNSQSHRDRERKQEYPNAMEKGADMMIYAMELGKRFVHDDTNSIVQYALSKDDGI